MSLENSEIRNPKSAIANPLRVLIIEDSEDDALLLLRELRRGGYEPVSERVETADAMKAVLQKQKWDLIISDYVLPRFSGLAALEILKESRLDLPFIIVSGNIGEDVAVSAMKAGAHDYIIKGNLKRLIPAVERELRDAEVRRERSLLKEIRKEREFIEAVLNNVEMLVIVLDRDGKILSFNRACETLTGFSFSEVKDSPFWDIFLISEEVEVVKTVFSELRAGAAPNRHENYWLTKSGERRFIEWTNSVIRDPEGSVKYVVGTGIDATERKQAEEALRDSEERFRLIAETSSDVIFQTDLQGRITYCSPAVAMFGYRTDHVLNSYFADYIPKPELPKAAAAFQRVTSGEHIDLFELKLLRSDGSMVHGEISVTPVVKEGHVTGIQGIARDITSRKHAEEALRRSKEELEVRVQDRTASLARTNQALEQEIREREEVERQLRNLSKHLQEVRESERTAIAREIHDELGQIITALRLELAWVRDRYKDQDVIFNKSKSMLALVDATIQTIQNIISELRPGILDVLGLFAAIEWQAGELKKMSGITCDLMLPSEDVPLSTDISTNIFRIVQELFTNIVRYANATTVSVEIEIKGDRLFLSVTDNGVGIDPQKISSPVSFGIIGIRERVYAMKGDMHIEGTPGIGTSVTITVPVQAGQDV